MTLASEWHFNGTVNIEALLALSRDVRYNWPESRRNASVERNRRFRDAVEEFARLLYAVDIYRLSDEELSAVERATRTVACLFDLHMMFDCDPGECMLSADISHKLRDAIEGIERGLPIDPAKRPTQDDLLRELAERLDRTTA